MEAKIVQKCLKETNEIFWLTIRSLRHDLTEIKITGHIALSATIRCKALSIKLS